MKKSKKSMIGLVACFVLSIFALVTFGTQVSTAQSMTDCARQCSDCQSACEKASAYCKAKGGLAASAEKQQLFADCIDLCKTSHALLQRESKFHPMLCKICAEACKECAKACESLKDPELNNCIKQCKKCAETCKHMAS